MNEYLLYKKEDSGEVTVVRVQPTEGGALVLEETVDQVGKTLKTGTVNRLTTKSARKLYRDRVNAGYRVSYRQLKEILVASEV